MLCGGSENKGVNILQTVTVQIRIYPSNPALLVQMGNEYISTVNRLTEQIELQGSFPKLTSKTVQANLPSAIKNQLIRDAKSIYQKAKKEKKRPVLKKRVYYINNQNYLIRDDRVAFPVVIDGKVQRITIPATLTDREKALLASSKLGLLRVVQKSSKGYVQVSIERPASYQGGTYTSQTCPACGQRNKAKDRTYQCSCGYEAHRDRVGAINIMRQPGVDGNSRSA
jgi:putative transposase